MERKIGIQKPTGKVENNLSSCTYMGCPLGQKNGSERESCAKDLLNSVTKKEGASEKLTLIHILNQIVKQINDSYVFDFVDCVKTHKNGSWNK